MTAVLREATLFNPGNECKPPAAASDFERLISGYRRTQTVLLGGRPLLCREILWKHQPYSGNRHYSLSLIVAPICAKRFDRHYRGQPAL